MGADTITTHAQATALLDAASTQRLRALAQAHQATLHHVLLAAWALTLGRSTDQQDVLVPTVLAGRPAELADADARVGLFINTVPMRVQWESGDSFASLLQRVQQASGEAARHQVLSLADIQARTGALPVDHVFLVQGLPGEAVVGRRCGDARVSAACFRESLPYALQVSLTPGPDGIGIVLQGRLESGSLQALANALRSLLAAVAAQPMRPLREHELLDAAQRATVLAWGDGGPAAGGGTLLQALDAQLARAPEAPALVCGEEHLSYRELHARANRLAHALLADGPLAPDTLVALVARRDAALVTGLLAILKAGAAYLPVDPEHPRQRVRQLLETAGCRHVLLAPGLQHVLPPSCGARVLPLAADAVAGQPDTPPECEVRPEQLAYVIFTSGSTGTPKGVMLTHANAASVLAAIPLAAGFQGPQRVLGATTVSFDISILELLGPLTWGGTLVLAGADEARDPAQLLGLVEREQVTVLQATPSRLRLLLAAEPDAARARAVLGRLGHVLVGGEALPAPLASELLALAPLRACNVYGPTETAIWSACWPLAPGPVRLGRALAGERLLVLSREGRLQPPGALGEIAIAGAGVARGYLNDPARTAARFVRLPDIAGPVYLTGDLGRWRTDGSLEFRGRRDDQVKLRGMRIELAELEQHLLRLPEVRAAAAAVREGPHGAELVAYLVGPAAADPPVLRAALAEALPAAMLPARFVLLDALPLTPAGKTDRRACRRRQHSLPPRRRARRPASARRASAPSSPRCWDSRSDPTTTSSSAAATACWRSRRSGASTGRWPPATPCATSIAPPRQPRSPRSPPTPARRCAPSRPRPTIRCRRSSRRCGCCSNCSRTTPATTSPAPISSPARSISTSSPAPGPPWWRAMRRCAPCSSASTAGRGSRSCRAWRSPSSATRCRPAPIRKRPCRRSPAVRSTWSAARCSGWPASRSTPRASCC